MTHGCKDCWPDSTDAAWKARSDLTHEAELIDESHFHVMILKCDRCGQRYLSAFAETVDWADGEDPQYWSLLPITDAEAGKLGEQRESTTEGEFLAPGPERRCLRRDFPKGSEPRAYWVSGMLIGPHD